MKKLYEETDIQNIANSIRGKNGETTKYKISDMSEAIDNIPTGGDEPEYKYTGHVDVEGLKRLGWTDAEIQNFQEHGVNWNEEDDDLYKVSEEEIVGTANTTYAKYLKTVTSQTTLTAKYNLLCIRNNNITKTSCANMFQGDYNLRTISLINTDNCTTMYRMFQTCRNLNTIPLLNTQNVNTMESMFYECYNLQTIPLLNTQNVANMSYMFNGCYTLKTIPLLNTSNVTSMQQMFYECRTLKDLGKAYTTTAAANYSQYKLELNQCNGLTHDSLMNVINNLYDIKSKGCNIQTLYLGSTNKGKLKAAEIAIATNKGWNVT